jgi:hypothetical protein
MILRVLAERPSAGRFASIAWLDYLGPLLMAAVLAVTAYLSWSSLPVWMGAVILVVLFPEMKADFEAAFPGLAWGSGLGSALSALVLTAGAFRIRSSPSLARLQGGDLFFGREAFPLRHADASLFTTPALVSAVFLCAKVLAWNLSQNLSPGFRLGLKTTAALGVVAVVWVLVAIFGREDRWAVAATHLAWMTALLAVAFAFDHLPGPPGAQWTFVATGLLLQGAEFLSHALARRLRWVEGLFLAPVRGVLQGGSLVLTAIVLVGLYLGRPIPEYSALALFLGVELVGRALWTGRRVFGATFFLLVWTVLLAWTAPGIAPLLDRIDLTRSLSPTLWLCLAVQGVHLVLEAFPEASKRLTALLIPFQLGATAILGGLGCFVLADALAGPFTTTSQVALALAGTLLTARAHGSGFFALVSGLLVYVLANDHGLRVSTTLEDRLEILLSPWRVSLLALTLAVSCVLGRALRAAYPRLVQGGLGISALRSAATPWLFGPATILVLVAALHHSADPLLREEPLQLLAPYLGALTLAVIGWTLQNVAYFAVAGALLTLSNVHAVRVFLGARLRAGGLSEDHLAGLGIGATLLQGSILNRLVRKDSVRAAVNTGSLPLATLILVLLATNYVAHPNVETIPPLRFAISGAMALLAGLYFRRAWLRPGPGEAAYSDLCASLYHYGVAVSIWCAALLVPWLRQPSTALLALGIPVVYFYARAELAFQDGDESLLGRYRSSAAVLGFVLLGL